MLELFQITGSCSFAARAALEEAGAEYETVDVHPRRRDEAPELRGVNPLRRVPSLRDGDELVYETGAVLLYLVERLPGRGLGPLPGEPGRGALLRWVTWLADTLHGAYHPSTRRGSSPTIRPATRESGSRAARSSTPTAPISSASSRAGRGASATSSRSPTSTSTCSRAGRATRTATRSAASARRPLRAGRRAARDRARARARRPRRAAAPLSPGAAGGQADRLSGAGYGSVAGEHRSSQRRIDVAAGDDEHVGPSATTAPVRSAASVSAPVGSTSELRLEREPAHRLEHGLVGDGHDLVDERRDGRERQLAERLRADAVADRPRHVGRRPA